jgi:hypothetical protein
MTEEKIIYQVTKEIEGIGSVVIDIAYSGDEDAEGNDILQFEFATVEPRFNQALTEDQIEEAMGELECGLEDEIVCELKEAYEGTAIRFDVGEYKFNPHSTLYDPNAESF